MSKRQSIKSERKPSTRTPPLEPRRSVDEAPSPAPVKPKNKGGLKPAVEKEAYEQKKEIIVQLRRLGWSYPRIGAHEKVQLHRSTVQEIMERILDAGVRKRTAEHIERIRYEKLEELREVRRFLWEVIIKSSEPERGHVEETVTMGEGEAGEGKPGKKAKFKKRVLERIQGRDGNVHAAQVLIDCIAQECKLEGISDRETEASSTGAVVNFFLPSTERNQKPATGDYTIPKQVEAKVVKVPKKPIPERVQASELVVVERTPPLPGSEDIK